MAENNGSKWQIGFWALGIIVTLALPGLGAAIVNNDRIRASEDQRIELTINDREQKSQQRQEEILQRLTRIETKIERSNR